MLFITAKNSSEVSSLHLMRPTRCEADARVRGGQSSIS